MWSGNSVLAALAVVLALAVQTAPTPDLSGTWIIDPARSSASGGGTGGGQGRGRAGGGGGLGRGPSATELVITQTAASLEIIEARPGSRSRIVLAIDGTNGRYEIGAGENAGQAAASTSHWKGDRLFTMVTVRTSGDGTRVYTEQRYLDNGALVVDMTMAGSASARKTIYTRKRE